MKFCVWDNCFIFLIATHVISRMLFDENYSSLGISIYLNFEMHLDCWCNVAFLNLIPKDSWFHLVSTITSIATAPTNQVNRLFPQARARSLCCIEFTVVIIPFAPMSINIFSYYWSCKLLSRKKFIYRCSGKVEI